jgi:predicted CXXCH cytochrome family protein
MRIRRVMKLSLAAGLLLLLPGSVQAEGNQKLKMGAKGKICRGCHTVFNKAVKKRFVHTPLKKGECTGCHNPHASAHGKLLSRETTGVCTGCHENIVKKRAKSKHKPVVENKCTHCHDAHASNYPANLLKPVKEMCGECHAKVVDAADAAKFKHAPLKNKGCTACHAPHSSTAKNLLKKTTPKLCKACHSVKTREFANKHMGFPVAKENCTGCHSAHGSDQPGMLHASAHSPVSKKMCTQCHEGLRSQTPLDLKAKGVELCRPCHAKTMKVMLNRNHVHAAVLSEDACLNCHVPHASSNGKLLRGNMTEVCGRCHADTIARYRQSPTKHKPVADKCGKCHNPHSSNNPLLFKFEDALTTCGSCHQWSKHTSHKVGKKYKDPRNPNLIIDCLSCHLGHGSEYKRLIPFVSTSALCTECHSELRR